MTDVKKRPCCRNTALSSFYIKAENKGKPVGGPKKAMAPHSSTLAWKIPRVEEPGRLQSMGSRRVAHDWATSLSLFHFHALEKEMATHSSVLAWRIPGIGEPGGLPSMGSHRVGHDWSDLAVAAAHIYLTHIYTHIYLTSSFFIHSPIDGRLGCFHVL